jgi:subtilisin family serine protease
MLFCFRGVALSMRQDITHEAKPSRELAMVNLTGLMQLGEGRPEVGIGLIDGDVARQLPDFEGVDMRSVGMDHPAGGAGTDHGTFVAGILSARRSSVAPAISPGCSLLVRPVFADSEYDPAESPKASPKALSQAITECVDAGARVLNLSAALVGRSPGGERILRAALDHAMLRGVVVVAAAGNQGRVGSSAMTGHPWVTPVVALDVARRPTHTSDLGSSIGRHGLCAPGEHVTSLSLDGRPVEGSGTSVAAPFVTGAIALLWSQFPQAPAAAVRWAVSMSAIVRRSVVPPVLDAGHAYLRLRQLIQGG